MGWGKLHRGWIRVSEEDWQNQCETLVSLTGVTLTRACYNSNHGSVQVHIHCANKRHQREVHDALNALEAEGFIHSYVLIVGNDWFNDFDIDFEFRTLGNDSE